MPRPSEETIFNTARRIEAPEARRRYLHEACGDDTDLEARVAALLRVHDEESGFLRSLPAGLPPVPAAPAPEAAGTVLGPYRLLEPLGQGGMGTVWLAEQTEPVQRRVALKVSKAGQGGTQVLARFEQERQTLARMDHPHIARVLDAGTTEAGRPYFVMELVNGIPLTRFCDEYRLTPRQRLELFLPVCQAVQHAHQKGIIHRDLKPSNILVTAYDGRPVPKVIDFGIAKAAGPRLADETSLTEAGAVVGTPEYMSPEQAELDNPDIDTRSDVYALGVVLYELLTGSTPLQRKSLKGTALVEVLRRVREEEPPRPSARLSDAEGLPAVAASRGLEPKQLAREVRGELDWIVLKCLDKDRNRRYETVGALALDLQRHLHHEPVQAGPPSALYRLRKFARRNRAALATTGLVTLALLLALGVSAWRIWLAKVEAETARQTAEEKRRLSDENLALADEVLERLGLQTAEQGLLTDDQREEAHLARLRQALRFYQQFADTNAADPAVRYRAGRAYVRVGKLQSLLGRDEQAERAFRQGMDLLGRVPGDSPRRRDARQALADAANDLGQLYRRACRFPEAENSFREALSIHEELVEREPGNSSYRQNLAASCGNLGNLLRDVGRLEEGDRLLRRARQVAERLVQGSPQVAAFQSSLALELHSRAERRRDQGDLKGALALNRRAVRHSEEAARLNPRGAPDRLGLCECYRGLALTLGRLGRHGEALKASERQRDEAARLREEFPRVPACVHQLAVSHSDRARALSATGRRAEAKQAQDEALRLLNVLLARHRDRPQYRRNLAVAQHHRAELLDRAGKIQQAEAAYRQVLEDWQRLPETRAKTAESRRHLGVFYLDLGDLLSRADRFAEAEKALGQGVRLFQGLCQEFARVSDYRWQLACGHTKLGILLLTSRPPRRAEKAIGEALGLHRQLVKDYPQVSAYRSWLAHTLLLWGHRLRMDRRFVESERALRQALDLRQELHEKQPDSLIGRRDVAMTHVNLGLLYKDSNRAAAAEAAYWRAQSIQEKVVAEAPDVPQFHDDLTTMLTNRGMMRLRAGDLTAARALFEQALRHGRHALKPDPGLPRYVRGYARCCINLADVLVKQGDHAALARLLPELADLDWRGSAQVVDYLITCAALAARDAKLSPAERPARTRAYVGQATAFLRKAGAQCPKTPEAQAAMQKWAHEAAVRLEKGGWQAQALDALQLCLGLTVSPSQAKDPDEYRRWQARTHYRLSALLQQAGRGPEAEKAARQALPLYQKLVQEFPKDVSCRFELGSTLNNLALLLRERGETAEACRHLERAVEHQKAAVGLGGADPKYRRALATHHGNLAETLLVRGDHAGAARAAREQPRALPEWEMYRSAACFLGKCLPVAERDPRLSAEQRKAVARGYTDEARALLREAVKRLQDDPIAQDDMARYLATGEEPRLHDGPLAVELARKATRRAPKVGGFWSTLGAAHYRAGQWEAAVAALGKAVQLDRGGDASDHFVLAMAHWRLAGGEPAGKETAREWYRRGAAWMARNPRALGKNEHFAARLRRLQAEAAALLGVKEGPPTAK
jgi:serine/threonine protein kinase/tetratricopeptide (TPR) repeat protein